MAHVVEHAAPVSPANEEAIEAWDGPLFDVFVRLRHILVNGLKAHGDRALALYPPPPGAQVLDIGCGFGDTTQQLAEAVGPEGSALGVDSSPRFIETAEREATECGIDNAAFMVGDIETAELGGPFAYAYSRMGTMFFANPVAALRNVRRSMQPGARLVMVVWRAKVENEWMYRPQLVTERFVTKPEDYDQPTCGPGPFSMAGADTTSGILVSAGFTDVVLHRCDLPIRSGRTLDEAVDLAMSIGPAGEILRLQGDRAKHLHEPVAAALREEMEQWVQPDGSVLAPASTWIVSAIVPEAAG